MDLPFVVLDTEFIRTDTFYPIAALIQVYAQEKVYLIDPLRIAQWKPLQLLLTASRIVKVFHACSEDIEVLYRLTGSACEPIFDTQIAASYINLGFSVGYSSLVRNMLGVELTKNESRSDWINRPLSASQQQYAIDDVLYLASVYLKIKALLSTEKHVWLLEDTSAINYKLITYNHVDNAYLSIKQAWRLTQQELFMLKKLCSWREITAAQQDEPRNRILRENTLIDLALKQPTSLSDLVNINDLYPKKIRQFGIQIIRIIIQALEVTSESWPALIASPLDKKEQGITKKIRQRAKLIADQLELAPEIILKRKMLEDIVRTGRLGGCYSIPDNIKGWRKELVGKKLVEYLNTFKSEG
ncbi:UNVERIFIED_CONTAM: hypothetical protein GTU68_002576 [Idotea baltica]|nr:hypothetical protein [Idotea baltica]